MKYQVFSGQHTCETFRYYQKFENLMTKPVFFSVVGLDKLFINASHSKISVFFFFAPPGRFGIQRVKQLTKHCESLWPQNSEGLTRSSEITLTPNVSGYMILNMPVNHSVNKGREWMCECLCVWQAACQHCHASPILGEVMPEKVVGGQLDGFLWCD